MQDLSSSTVANELNMEKVEFDMHQGDKAGVSAVRELTRSKDKEKLHAHSLYLCHKILMLKPCGFDCN